MMLKLLKQYKFSAGCFLLAAVNIIGKYTQAESTIEILSYDINVFMWIILGILFKIMQDVEEIKQGEKNGAIEQPRDN